MKSFFLSAAVFVMVGMAPLSAWAASCALDPFPKVQVKVLDPKERLSTSRSLKQINSSAQGHGAVGKGKVALGTTESRVSTDMRIQFQWRKKYVGSGSPVCVQVKSITANFGHSKLVVNLPREYKRGSCQYKVVYRHEMAHVQVNRNGVRKYGALLRFEIIQELQRSLIVEATTMSRGTQIFQKRLKSVMEKITKRFNQEIKMLHGKIDAPNSPYAAKGTCRSW
ncbi:MAG: hypothetical protein JKY92_03905 [Magnetovibrio sp.]|nr:hypothetical protein [Magnetovibrio sp.]